MTTLRTAAQQALEAIDWLRHHLTAHHGCLHTDSTASGIPAWLNKSETALKAALADGDNAAPTEPVAWVLALPDGRLDRLSVVAYGDEAEEMLQRSIAGCTLVPLHAAPPQRPAEPVQEPVAWVDLQKAADEIVRGKTLWKRFIDGTPLANDISCWMAEFALLYTAPPQRKPLTEEEIQELSQQHKFDSRMEKFVRIIEQAHGIGGKDD